MIVFKLIFHKYFLFSLELVKTVYTYLSEEKIIWRFMIYECGKFN